MFLRFEATLNGGKFSEIADEVILTDIIEQPAEVDQTLSRWANRPGQRLSARTRTALSVRLVYVIRTQDIARRAEVRDLVAAWAREGGTLAVNYRPGKHLYVTMDAAPALDSSLKWTQELSLTLTAYEQPYWEDDTATSFSLLASYDQTAGYAYGFGNFSVAGTAHQATVSRVTINNYSMSQNEVLTNVKITLQKSSILVSAPKREVKSEIELTGLSLSPGDGVEIFYSVSGPAYEKPGVLYIREIKSKNDLFYARTASSSDDLLVAPGCKNQLIVISNINTSTTVEAKGWWL